MTSASKAESLPTRARKLEESYDWAGAIGHYEETLKEVSSANDREKAPSIYERIGYSQYRHARQADNRKALKDRMLAGISAFQAAKDIYSRLGGGRFEGNLAECAAWASHLRYWLGEDFAERKRNIDDWWARVKQASSIYREVGALDDLLRLAADNLTYVLAKLDLEWDDKAKRETTLEEATEFGDRIVKELAVSPDRKSELMLVTAALLLLGYEKSYAITPGPERDELQKQIRHYAQICLSCCESAANSFDLAYAHFGVAWAATDSDISSCLTHARKMLHHATLAGDLWLKQVAQYLIAYSCSWMSHNEANPDVKRQWLEEARRTASDAAALSTEMGFEDWAYRHFSELAESYWQLAYYVEFEIDRKRELLSEAVQAGKRAVDFQERSRAFIGGSMAYHNLSKALYFISTLERSEVRRASLLEEALTARNQSITFPGNLDSWDRGVFENYAALIKADKSELAHDGKEKIKLLQEAAEHMERCLAYCKKYLETPGGQMFSAPLGLYSDWYTQILYKLFNLNHDPKTLEKLVEVGEESATYFAKAGHIARVAEARWRIAQALGILGKHTDAASNFETAARQFELSAENISSLADFYREHSKYMRAWSEIEGARGRHEREDFSEAAARYRRASELLGSSSGWAHLGSHYEACAILEEAQQLSQEENTSKAKVTLAAASLAFSKSEAEIETRRELATEVKEREELGVWLQITRRRGQYCKAHEVYEEAEMLELKGDKHGTAERYGAAARTFEKIAVDLGSTEDARDLRALAFLSWARQKMKLAEIEASPERYAEASGLFVKARELLTAERAIHLALGNGFLCKALEYEMRFKHSRRKADYSSAKTQLEGALTHYLEAGYERSVAWTRGTQSLLDAYLYVADAESEVEPAKKTKLYHLAEGHLQSAIRNYESGGYVQKKQEMQRYLARVREEKAILVSPVEAVGATDGAMPTFIPPTKLTSDQPLGLDRFEAANVVANVIVERTEVEVDGEIGLELELVNAGKNACLLVKVEGLVPAGFDIVKKPEAYNFENSYVNMKGKRLQPLGTEELQLSVTTSKLGMHTIKPRIFYLDESGHYKTHEPPAIVLTVKEKVAEGAPVEVRLQTGNMDLDQNLYGGIPANYAVIVTTESSDELDVLLRRFIQVGLERGESVIYISNELDRVADYIDHYPTQLRALLATPQPDADEIKKPNTKTVKGIENLTELNLRLNEVLDISPPKVPIGRACVTLLSEVLLRHHALTTRKWLSELLARLKRRNYTVLATINPLMHSTEETHAITDLFDGQFDIQETKISGRPRKSLRVRRLLRQKCRDQEIILTK